MADPTGPEGQELAESQAWVEPLLEVRELPPGAATEGPTRWYPTPNSNATLRRWLVIACVLALLAIVVALLVELL